MEYEQTNYDKTGITSGINREGLKSYESEQKETSGLAKKVTTVIAAAGIALSGCDPYGLFNGISQPDRYDIRVQEEIDSSVDMLNQLKMMEDGVVHYSRLHDILSELEKENLVGPRGTEEEENASREKAQAIYFGFVKAIETLDRRRSRADTGNQDLGTIANSYDKDYFAAVKDLPIVVDHLKKHELRMGGWKGDSEAKKLYFGYAAGLCEASVDDVEGFRKVYNLRIKPYLTDDNKANAGLDRLRIEYPEMFEKVERDSKAGKIAAGAFVAALIYGAIAVLSDDDSSRNRADGGESGGPGGR